MNKCKFSLNTIKFYKNKWIKNKFMNNLWTTIRQKTTLPDLNLKAKTNQVKLEDLIVPVRKLDNFN